MIIFSQDISTAATPEKIWQIWADVQTWPKWYQGLKNAELSGPIEAGTTGILNYFDGSKKDYKVLEATPNAFLKDVIYFPLGLELIGYSYLHQNPNGKTTFAFRLEVVGWWSWIFAFFARQKLNKMVPESLKIIIEMAEKL